LSIRTNTLLWASGGIAAGRYNGGSRHGEQLAGDLRLPGFGAFDLGELLGDVDQVQLKGFDFAEPRLRSLVQMELPAARTVVRHGRTLRRAAARRAAMTATASSGAAPANWRQLGAPRQGSLRAQPCRPP
jgi:hypothetical protein